MNPFLYVGIFLVLYLFFSGVQSVYRSANRILVEIEKHKSGIVSSILTKTTQNPPRFMAAMFIGEITSLILLTLSAVHIIYSTPIHQGAVIYGVLALIILGLLRIVISKMFCKLFANEIIRVFAVPALLCYFLLYPFADLAIRISHLLSKLFYKQSLQPFYTGFSSDISEYISDQIESAGNREEVDAEIRIFQNALIFPDVKAREVMTPRTEITAVEIESPTEYLQKLFQETGYSKILVYKDSLDNIVGYVHSFELFKKSGEVKDMLILPVFVPESMPAGTVLKKLIKARKSIAVVIDEFGGTAGMLTTEDIVEELFGEIEDEHDSDELLEIQLSENHFRFSARLEVDYINQKYHLNLPEDDSYETLGGMIFHYAKEIPKKGEIIPIAGYQTKILSVSNTRIQEIELSC